MPQNPILIIKAPIGFIEACRGVLYPNVLALPVPPPPFPDSVGELF